MDYGDESTGWTRPLNTKMCVDSVHSSPTADCTLVFMSCTTNSVFLYYSDDLPKLKYLTMCIRESLRIYTTVPFTQRETTKDITIDGRHVPAGTLVSILLYSLHHIKEVWTDPEEYRPDRFSPENMENMDAFAYCPFSAGPRSDIILFSRKVVNIDFLQGLGKFIQK